jgi:hypothetical protein
MKDEGGRMKDEGGRMKDETACLDVAFQSRRDEADQPNTVIHFILHPPFFLLLS